MAQTLSEKELSSVRRRMASVTNHLMVPSPAASSSKCDSVELVPNAASMNDNYHRVHGDVSNKEVVWRNVAASDGSTTDFTDIIYQKAVGEGIAKIAINRPERRNAFRPQTIKELIAAFNDARDDSSVGVIILTGQGTKAFCSGGDQALRTKDGYADPNDMGRLNVLDLQVQIRRLPKPVIAMAMLLEEDMYCIWSVISQLQLIMLYLARLVRRLEALMQVMEVPSCPVWSGLKKHVRCGF